MIGHGTYYLQVAKYGWFKYPKVFANVYPIKGGGDTVNTYDILANKDIATGEIIEFIKSVVVEYSSTHDSCLGEIRWRDTLGPYINHIAEINETYKSGYNFAD